MVNSILSSNTSIRKTESIYYEALALRNFQENFLEKSIENIKAILKSEQLCAQDTLFFLSQTIM